METKLTSRGKRVKSFVNMLDQTKIKLYLFIFFHCNSLNVVDRRAKKRPMLCTSIAIETFETKFKLNFQLLILKEFF